MESFSVVITTYNSEKYLKLCLESVHELANEIIIVDGFSTDNTAKIANSFPRLNFILYRGKVILKQKTMAITWLRTIGYYLLIPTKC